MTTANMPTCSPTCWVLSCRRILEQLALKEQPACSLLSKIPGSLKTYIHSWKHLSDVGVQLQAARELMQLEAEAAGRMPAWQPVQQLSIQEEGEVADGDISSHLLPGETADEELLQGLLEDDRAANGAEPGADGDKQLELVQQQQQRRGEEGAALEERQDQGAGGAEEYAGMDDGLGLLLAEASAGSELLPGEGGADAAAAGSSGPERTVRASHSLYRLVLKAPALEVHLHGKVYYNYPLCPPVFAVTKMLDTSSRSDPTPLCDVNEALKLQQQVRCGRKAPLTACRQPRCSTHVWCDAVV